MKSMEALLSVYQFADFFWKTFNIMFLDSILAQIQTLNKTKMVAEAFNL